jgi:hypothetical protein
MPRVCAASLIARSLAGEPLAVSPTTPKWASRHDQRQHLELLRVEFGGLMLTW